MRKAINGHYYYKKGLDALKTASKKVNVFFNKQPGC